MPFFFTDQSFTRVLSALVNGAYITYGDEGRAVIWEFLRNVEFPVSICDQIVDCIENNPSTRQAIIDALFSDPSFIEKFEETVGSITEGQLRGKLVEGDCSDPIVAGRALTLVNRLDTNNIDFLDFVEVGTNDEERVGDLLEAIPILGELPIGDIIQIGQDILEDFSENYDAASTIARREAMARDIWCLMKENEDCSLTFEQLFNYLQTKALSGLTIASTLSDVLNFVRNGDFGSDDLVFYGLMAVQVGFILRGQDFYSMGVPTMGSLMRDAAPSTIWEEWEPCLPEWCYTQDLTADDTNMVLDYTEDGFVYQSEFVLGTGIIGARSGLLDENIPKYVLPSPARIVSVEFTVNVGDPTNAFWYMWPNGDTAGPSGTVVSGVNVLSADINEDCDFVMFGNDRSGGLRTPIGPITSVTFRGTGTNPFGTSNC